MVSLRPLFSNMFSLLIMILFHLGCFSFHHDGNSISLIKKKLLTSPKKKIFSFFRTLISSSSSSSSSDSISQPLRHIVIPSPSSSTRSHPPIMMTTLTSPKDTINNPTQNHANTDNKNKLRSTSNSDIHPCSTCGELFTTPDLLQLHQYTKHAVSQLLDGENIIRIIFKMGWPEKIDKSPTIHRILKIHNSPRIASKFEEYREYVKSMAATASSSSSHKYCYSKNNTSNLERCIADGNELLRFYCTTYTCDLNSSICTQQYCSVCGIIRSGFSAKVDGISLFPTSWKAHVAVPDDLEVEFGFMGVRRALLLCRVVAGRVGSDSDTKDPEFESLVGQFDQDELVVVNPRAVLPCFVIVYTV